MLRLSLLIPLLAMLGARTEASALVLWPIDPKIEGDQSATMLWVENQGSEPVTLQIRSFAWTQAEGKDVHERQNEVVASPPIAKLTAGQRQLIRIIRRAPAMPGGERSYRLLIDELPAPVGTTESTRATANLAMQMRYSIPLFTRGATATEPQLSTRVLHESGQRFLEIRNSGTGHARLVNLRIRRGAHETPVNHGLVGYVLPGAVMRWPLPATAPIGGGIIVSVNGRDLVLGPSV
jgi:fimbrial chaperone protein